MEAELPYDPTILLLGIYAEEWKGGTRGDTYPSVLKEALFMIAERKNSPKVHQ